MSYLILLAILSCYNPTTIIGDVSSLEIYNDVSTDFIYIKFSSDTDFRHVQSAEFGQPLKFNYCSDSQVTIKSETKEMTDYLRRMTVLINSDTIYNSWRFAHEIVINLKTKELEKWKQSE